MFRSIRIFLPLLAFLTLQAASAGAPPAPILDPSFSGDGIRLLPSTQDAWPVVTCPAANGRRLVVVRDDAHKISITRLLENGSSDPQFGTGGVKQFAMVTYPGWRPTPALCRSNGDIWVVTQIRGVGSDTNLRVLAISAAGDLIAGFAGSGNGVLDIDLDQSSSQLADYEYPRSIQPSADGGALIVGHVRMADTHLDRPFLIKLAPGGSVQKVTFPVPAGLSQDIHANAVATGPNGGIWVVGDGAASGLRAYRMYIDPVTYAVVHTEIGLDANVYTSSGVLLRSGVMVVGASQYVGVPERKPRLLVFRTGGSMNMLALPDPTANWASPGHAAEVMLDGDTVAALSNDRIVFSGELEVPVPGVPKNRRGIYFARAVIAQSALDDHVDAAFGVEGSATLSVDSVDPSCAGDLNEHRFSQVGSWNQRPLVLAVLATKCNPDSSRKTLLLRLNAGDALFDDGFDLPLPPV